MRLLQRARSGASRDRIATVNRWPGSNPPLAVVVVALAAPAAPTDTAGRGHVGSELRAALHVRGARTCGTPQSDAGGESGCHEEAAGDPGDLPAQSDEHRSPPCVPQRLLEAPLPEAAPAIFFVRSGLEGLSRLPEPFRPALSRVMHRVCSDPLNLSRLGGSFSRRLRAALPGREVHPGWTGDLPGGGQSMPDAWMRLPIPRAATLVQEWPAPLLRELSDRRPRVAGKRREGRAAQAVCYGRLVRRTALSPRRGAVSALGLLQRVIRSEKASQRILATAALGAGLRRVTGRPRCSDSSRSRPRSCPPERARRSAASPGDRPRRRRSSPRGAAPRPPRPTVSP
jgi:hypothetical protein